MHPALLITMLTLTTAAHAQWKILDAHTTASLRGVSSPVPFVAWVSGTQGTVLRTEYSGEHWLACSVPTGAQKLDFRGIQAFDNDTAIVMSSGTGDLSRLYKTTDGCKTWKLLLTNPDSEGFWDAVVAYGPSEITLLGDPVDGHFILRRTSDGGRTWQVERSAASTKGEGAFAASNSSLLADNVDGPILFGTGGPLGARLFMEPHDRTCKHQPPCLTATDVTNFPKGASAGIFSLAAAGRDYFVAVGGDYQSSDTPGAAATSTDGGSTWQTSQTAPRGYRSAVGRDARHRSWIAVGPNGTDISTDNGRNWRALKPGPGDAPGVDKDWNALSLPFVVGPHGRIGIRQDNTLAPGRKPSRYFSHHLFHLRSQEALC